MEDSFNSEELKEMIAERAEQYAKQTGMEVNDYGVRNIYIEVQDIYYEQLSEEQDYRERMGELENPPASYYAREELSFKEVAMERLDYIFNQALPDGSRDDYLTPIEMEEKQDEALGVAVSNRQLGDLSVPLHIYPSGWDYVPEKLHDELQDYITQYAIDNYALTRDEAIASIKSELKQDDEGLAALKGIKESSKNASEEEGKILERELQKNAFYFYKLDTKDGAERYINLDSVNAAENSFVTPIVTFLKSNEQTKAQFENPQDVIYLLGAFKRDPQAADVVLSNVSDDVKRSKELADYAASKGIDLKAQGNRTAHIEAHEHVAKDVPKLAEVAHKKRSRR